MRRIIGITRFALVGNMGEGQFHFPHRKKPAQYTRRDWVFSKGYLAHRLQLWQAFALPCISAFTVPEGYDYTHLVAINPDLPNKEALQLTLPKHVQLVEIGTHERLEVGLMLPLNWVIEGHEYFTFRLDDDDALTTNYLQMVADKWDRGYDVITPVEGWFIGVDRMSFGEPMRAVAAVNAGSPHGIGAYNKRIHDLGKHNAIPGTVGITDRVYWLRTVHRSNVSLAGNPNTPWGKKRTENVDPLTVLANNFPHLSAGAVEDALRRGPS